MKILKKIITAYLVIAAFAITLKIGDTLLAKADTMPNCGTNTGWIWNGRECVNTCDQNHPWDPNLGKCSNMGGSYYSTNYYTGSTGNCAVYGSNFYFNGTNCVQINAGQNVSYNGSNPYNGGVYYINGQNVNYNYVNTNYTNTNPNINYTNTNNNSYQNTQYPYNNYVNNNSNYYDSSYGCTSSCWQNPAPKTVTTYKTYTYYEYVPGTPIPTYGTPNYTYLGSNNNNCWYPSTGFCNCGYTNIGYYDSYGQYHY